MYLLKQVYLPTSPEAAATTLELLNILLEQIPVFLLSCDISRQAVQIGFEALTGLNFEEVTAYEN